VRCVHLFFQGQRAGIVTVATVELLAYFSFEFVIRVFDLMRPLLKLNARDTSTCLVAGKFCAVVSFEMFV